MEPENIEDMNIYEQKQNIEDAFGVYLKECCGIDKSESPYNDLSSIDECLRGRNMESLYDINTVEDIDAILPYLEENGLYESRQEESITEQPQSFTDVLNNYRNFLVAYKFAQEWAKPVKSENQNDEFALNTIVFGAPGTGKSHSINNFIKKNKIAPTVITFHPDTDYASFVGCYKPTKGNDDLTYKFVPQAFTNAYIEAWTHPDKNHVLLIEEINRGNCAQIFGDIFQLLDRYEEDGEGGTKGQSKYPINADSDLKEYLNSRLSSCDFSDIKDEDNRNKVQAGEKIMLPSNLYILATMNTSDQSLYPMDSAFKRRWEWKYMPICYDIKDKFIVTDTKGEGEGYSWSNFLESINDKIYYATNSEDKKLGFWFTGESQVISVTTFVNKVVFYLWNDVFKDYNNNKSSPFGEFTFQSFYDYNGNPKLSVVKDFLEKQLKLESKDKVFKIIEDLKKGYEKLQKTKSKKNDFIVTIGGKIISGESAKDVFVKAIEEIGPERVQALGQIIRKSVLVSSNPNDFKNAKEKISGGLYLDVNLSNADKEKYLNKIGHALSIDIQVNPNDSTTEADENPD